MGEAYVGFHFEMRKAGMTPWGGGEKERFQGKNFFPDPPTLTDGRRIERGSDDFLDFEWIGQRASNYEK